MFIPNIYFRYNKS